MKALKVPFKFRLHTDGRGLWSDVVKPVEHLRVELIEFEPNFGELRAYFHMGTWDISKHGLIYTDPKWLDEFQDMLKRHFGLSRAAVEDVDYSEQGMQGDNYVSLDVGRKFLIEFNAFYKRAVR